MGKLIIYALHHDDSQSVYVGKSTVGVKRMRQHAQPYELDRYSGTPRAKWIRRLRADDKMYKGVVLEECTSKDELTEAEIYYIAYFRSIGMKLLNATDGGDGAYGRKYTPSEETRVKQSLAMKIYASTPEGRESIRRARSAQTPDIRSRAVAKRNRTVGVSEATREKIAVSNRGKKHSKETRQKIGEGSRRAWATTRRNSK